MTDYLDNTCRAALKVIALLLVFSAVAYFIFDVTVLTLLFVLFFPIAILLPFGILALFACLSRDLVFTANSVKGAFHGLKLLHISSLTKSTARFNILSTPSGFVALEGTAAHFPPSKEEKNHIKSAIWERLTVDSISLFGLKKTRIYEGEWAQPFLLVDDSSEALVLPIGSIFNHRKRKQYTVTASSSRSLIPNEIVQHLDPDERIKITREYISLGERLFIMGDLANISAPSSHPGEDTDNQSQLQERIINYIAKRFGEAIPPEELKAFAGDLNSYLSQLNRVHDNVLHLLGPPEANNNRYLISAKGKHATVLDMRKQAWSLLMAFALTIAMIGYMVFSWTR